MRQRQTGSKLILLGATLLVVSPLLMAPALARPGDSLPSAHRVHVQARKAQAPTVTKTHTVAYSSQTTSKARGPARVTRGGGLSCVPFARMESGIAVPGNAWQWWGNAAGVYSRGPSPEAGSVLAFRANGRMRMGHVAVVARVINPREVLIDHANWPGGGRGGVSEAIPVVDVSEANDWSAVRVGLGRSGDYGSVYPTYGFIYDRPDTGILEARRHTPMPQLAEVNPPPRDLRPVAQRQSGRYEEVAEAPLSPRRRVGVILPRGSDNR